LCHLLHKWHKNEPKKGQFEPAGLGKLIEKQFKTRLKIASVITRAALTSLFQV
jgi:hypothetical protein